jgi:HK97 family phage major capsid protein
METLTIEELTERIGEITSEIRELDAEYSGKQLEGEARERWNALNAELEERKKLKAELEARAARVAEIGNKPENAEPERRFEPFTKPRDRGDIYDLSTIRSSVSNPEGAGAELVERARVAVDRDAVFPHERADQARLKEHLDVLLHTIDQPAALAEHILRTGSKTYRRAFGKAMKMQLLSQEEQRVLSMASERALVVADGASSAGLAVPYTLDPTIIPTSNGAVNPIRQVARIEQITGLEWRGVTSGAVTANRRAEEAEATDNAPTLAQPSRRVSRVDVWIPFSFEAGQDWSALETEMARLIQDAKDEEEAASFFTGNGTLPNPQGVLTGTTNTVNATSPQTFSLANLYALMGALPPRYRPRAAYMADLLIANLTRQFDTAGGAGLWTTLANDTPPQLLGKPFYEASGMPDTPATGNKFFLYGDFSRYIVVDRIGMMIETVQHVVGTNHRPTGQRGLFAFWRNNAFVADANGFRALIGVA